ncbi:hypothetical protein FACI_IFERC00001G1951 [Ferroplasma acidarmanus Fer1]|uniref:Uncharacterized protein n=1 Tax=Ferroplasma acidarmanus Fer1 TaxID=333146 RepID=S0ASZ4_FERAC|nr:hypothetical protein FACI_IFERC00001G1951 [Ferroplasma acidarmanus Fer1]
MKILAEQDLENLLLSGSLKKDDDVMEMVFEYINKGLRISKVASISNMSSYSF